jgi:hypothetical protein
VVWVKTHDRHLQIRQQQQQRQQQQKQQHREQQQLQQWAPRKSLVPPACADATQMCCWLAGCLVCLLVCWVLLLFTCS